MNSLVKYLFIHLFIYLFIFLSSIYSSYQQIISRPGSEKKGNRKVLKTIISINIYKFSSRVLLPLQLSLEEFIQRSPFPWTVSGINFKSPIVHSERLAKTGIQSIIMLQSCAWAKMPLRVIGTIQAKRREMSQHYEPLLLLHLWFHSDHCRRRCCCCYSAQC